MKSRIFFYRLLVSIIILSTWCNILFADQKMTIAVLNLQANGVSSTLANTATDIIRSEFVNVANFTIVERGAMDEILKEQGFQMTGCTDQSCAVKIGRLLSARKMIIGEINKMENAAMITLRIIDVEKGVSEFSAREKADSMDKIDDAAVKIARQLTQRIVTGEKEFFSPISPLGYYTRSIVPGWGQLYADRPGKAATIAGVFLLSALISYYQYTNYNDMESAYNDEPPGSSNFKNRRDDYQNAVDRYNYSLGLIGIVYVAHWVDAVFFSKPDFGTMSAANEKENEGLFVSIGGSSLNITGYSETRFECTAGIRF